MLTISGPSLYYRRLRFFVYLLWALLLAAFYLPWLGDEGRRRLIQRWCRKVLPLLRIRVTVSGSLPDRTVMLVANHISWVDPWVINSAIPARFVAKSEVRLYPIVGWLAKQCGVIFIERAKRRDTARVAGKGAEGLRQGDSLCVFPEGTTTEGTYILPFRSSLLQAAMDAGVDVVPVGLRYLSADGSANTDVAFIGEMNLWESLTLILSQSQIRAELSFLQPISSAGQDRQTLAKTAQQQVMERLHLPQRTIPGKAGDPVDGSP